MKPRGIFLDFVTHHGGAPRSTIELALRLSPYLDLRVLDPYGTCDTYADAVRHAGMAYQVLCPEQAAVVIGNRHSPLSRAVKLAASLPALSRLRGRLGREIGRFGPDFIWTSSPKALSVIAPLFGSGVPVLFYVRTASRPELLSPWSRHLLRRKVAMFVCLSHRIADNVHALGIERRRIAVVPNAVDLDILQALALGEPDPPLPDVQRSMRILLPGTLVPNKGQLTAVQALETLVGRGVDAALYLAGDVPRGSGPAYLAAIEQTAGRLGVGDRVHMLGWRSDIPRIMRASTVVVLPSTTEGMPRTVMEAMALRVPVVSTPVGATPELLQDGKAGWLVSPDDHVALAEALHEQHHESALSRARADAAYTSIEACYTRESQVKCFLQVIDDLLSRRFM